jgi:hypothetical protein
MLNRPIDRRKFLLQSAQITAMVSFFPWFNACSRSTPKSTARKGKLLTLAEWQTSEALAGILIPADRVDYVVEGDVVHYIDNALSTRSFRKRKKLYFWGLNSLNKEAKRLHQSSFAELNASRQRDVVEIVLTHNYPKGKTGQDFVRLALLLVLEGLFGDPVYGGNKNLVGWQMIGFDQNCRRPSIAYGQ